MTQAPAEKQVMTPEEEKGSTTCLIGCIGVASLPLAIALNIQAENLIHIPRCLMTSGEIAIYGFVYLLMRGKHAEIDERHGQTEQVPVEVDI